MIIIHLNSAYVEHIKHLSRGSLTQSVQINCLKIIV